MKKFVFSLRFSILSIFVALFLIAMLSLMALTHLRFTSTLSYLSMRIMQQVSLTLYEKVNEEIRDAKIETEMSAELLSAGVINPKKFSSILDYTFILMKTEAKTLPSVQSAYWGDEKGNFIISSDQENDAILSEAINRTTITPIHEIIERDTQNKTITHEYMSDVSYDPRLSIGYITAKKEKDTIVTGLYQYKFYQPSSWGITIATPVLNTKGEVSSVFAMNLRVDYLQHFIENMYVSKHGVIFVLTDSGKIIIFPHMKNVKDFPSPWLKTSYDRYKLLGATSFSFQFEGKEYLATYQALPKFGNEQWLIAVVAPESDFTGALRKANYITIFLCIVIFIVGILIVSMLITRVVGPLKKVVTETEEIKNFQLEGGATIKSHVKEIIDLANALSTMKKGLRAFKKYVPATLVRQIIEAGEEASIGGAKKPLAILFTDIKNFATIAEHMDPKQLMAHMCDYFSELSAILVEEKATIDKYIGDSIMAFWGAPLSVSDPCLFAAMATLRCAKRLKELNAKWVQENKPTFFTRFGLHSGEAIVGNLGSVERLNYTAVGDAINIASRLEGVNKLYGTEIMVSEPVYQALKNRFLFRMVDHVALKGKENISVIYELIAENQDDLEYDFDAYKENFQKGFAEYQAQNWDKASEYFSVCLSLFPKDTVTIVFLARCHRFKHHPPKEWDGAWHEFG